MGFEGARRMYARVLQSQLFELCKFDQVFACFRVWAFANATGNLILAGNFNITNNEDLFGSLVQLGQHPRELSDTVTLLEKIGHFVDKENNDLYVKYSAAGHSPQTCFSLIAENINIARILRRASSLWDGGYCIAGLLGHGDAFVMRDPSGIRPAFYYADDEFIVVCSEAPLIQTVFNVNGDHVHPLPPGQALCIKRSGAWTLDQILAVRSQESWGVVRESDSQMF